MQAHNQSWLSCFDLSPASTSAYVQAVYGDTGDFNWSAANVIWPWYLRQRNDSSNETAERCVIRQASVYKKKLIHAMWPDYRTHETTGHVPTKAHINRGGLSVNGTRRRCRPTVWGWIEVMHQPSVSVSRWYQASWANQLWVYKARGSGLWYNAGRTLLCSDTIDLAEYLNYSGYKRMVGDTKPPMFEMARHRLAGSFDSISFENHIDGACCHRMVMHEIFSIHNHSGGCPVSSRMRRGRPPRLRPCDCTGLAGTVPSGPRGCPSDHDNSTYCQAWARKRRLRGTIVQECATLWARHRCAGSCCKNTPWPIGMYVAKESNPWHWVQPVC